MVQAESERVHAGWRDVERLERAGDPTLLSRVVSRMRAKRTEGTKFKPFKIGKRMRPATLRIYQRPGNQARFRRTLDYVLPGDRVFEVGLGKGYFSGLLVRDGEVAAHRGVDLLENNVLAAQELLELNGLDGRSELGTGDLYDLTSDEVEGFGATLVTCCEVIEHVPDPEKALRTLAAALPKEAELLVSVPLLGRLERVWGHIAIFDHERARAMVEDAGLIVHSAEVVFGTWIFMLASHDPEPSTRGQTVAGKAGVGSNLMTIPGQGLIRRRPPVAPRSTRTVKLATTDAQATAGSSLIRHDVRLTDAGKISCSLKAAAGRSAGRGGFRLPVGASRGIRLELALDDIAAVRRISVNAFRDGQRVGGWTARAGRLQQAKKITASLRPGVRDPRFQAAAGTNFESADAYEVVATIDPGSSAKFRLTRAAIFE